MRAAVRALTLTLLAVTLAWAQATGTAEDNLNRNNITLPAPATPGGNYVSAVRVGNLLFVSATGPGQSTKRGKVGSRDLY